LKPVGGVWTRREASRSWRRTDNGLCSKMTGHDEYHFTI
jgi:hypothetical protein